MGRRRCWSGAVAAAFALLLLAPSPAFATTRATLLLIKTHHPTSAMLQCFCELAAEVIASRHNSAVFILATRTSRCTAGRCTHASSPRAAFEAAGCGARQELVDVSTEAWLARRPFNATHGFAVGLASLYPVTEYLDVLQELNWFDTNRAREFDYVLEQDVAWSGGRLLPVLAAAGAGPGADGADVVCHMPATFLANLSDAWPWWSAHSGWVGTVAPVAKLHRTHTYTRCAKFVYRLSRRLLTFLTEYTSRGHWAQDEWFAPTVCLGAAAAGWQPPCRVTDLRLSCPACLGAAFKFDAPVNATAWAAAVAAVEASGAGQLWHPNKL